ncbi:MAG: hypothetical protein IKE60_26345 [Reyranella sp.]|uniref:hypothetical protein n=1 Tax=Reyranella sp. TaxID=1929291 RepID=UPI0025F4A672|nr:hypothetical protein [Reyranella sp.]MBR2818210.1 hypothetical protein [Reyranella sp.]
MKVLDVTGTNPLTESRLIKLIAKRFKSSMMQIALLVTADQYETMKSFKGMSDFFNRTLYVGPNGLHCLIKIKS